MADRTEVHEAIQRGIMRAADAGMTKVFDIALFVSVQLSKEGFRVVRKPSHRKEKADGR